MPIAIQKLPFRNLIPPVLGALLGITAAIISLPHDSYRWPKVRDLGATFALDEPAWLAASPDPVLLWRPLDAETPLTYQMPGAPEHILPLLPYADLHPRRWQAAPAVGEGLHLVWMEMDGRLRSTLIDSQGTTVRGPIELASAVDPGFVLLGQRDYSAAVFWINNRQGQAAAVQIDAEGRPGPVQNLIASRVSFLAAGITQTDQVVLAWLSPAAPREWVLSFQTLRAPDFEIAAPETLHQFTLAPDETIVSFSMGMDQTHRYVLWSVFEAKAPDAERFFVLTFPAAQPGNCTVSEIQLPARFDGPARRLKNSRLEAGPIQRVTVPTQPAVLRWPRPAQGQFDVLPVALSVRTRGGWQPGVIYFQQGQLAGFQIVSDHPADAGSPALAVSPSGNMFLAWLGLKAAVPHLYTASTAGQGLDTDAPNFIPSVLRILLGAAMGWGFGWIGLRWITHLALRNRCSGVG
jgi:hypothetical protein